MKKAWMPKLVESLRDYDRKQFLSDLIAGLTVGLVALPLAMAFAISSGVPPQAGLYCGAVAGFLISALGGSKTQIGGLFCHFDFSKPRRIIRLIEVIDVLDGPLIVTLFDRAENPLWKARQILNVQAIRQPRDNSLFN